jgi:hypothetical protein
MKINDCGQGGPFFAAVDHAGQPLLFRTDSDQRLHLMRFCAERGWRRICLSAALPAGGTLRVACADVRQMGDGRIVAAICTLDREGRSRLHVVCGLSCGLDDEGWTAAMRTAQEAVLPDGVQVSRLDFGPLQAGAPPLLLVTGIAGGAECHWHLNAAAAFVPARALRMPDGMAGATGYAVGCFRLPGLWALCPEGCEGLRFCSFPDAFGWKVEVQYAGLPADAASANFSSACRGWRAWRIAEAVDLGLGLDSVGSIISVPATGQLMVGAWKPQSIRRLATSSTVTPALSTSGRVSMMHSCATRPLADL